MSRVSTLSNWASKLNRRKTPWVVDEGLLRSLVPLNLLGAAELRRLVERSRVVKLGEGNELRRDPAAAGTGYLLSGIIELLSGGAATGAVAAGTDAARHPVWDAKSGIVNLRAKTEVTVLEIEVATDELVLSSGASAADYEVSDIRSATATDWLTRFLQAKVFIRLPLNNIRELLARMQEIDVDAGEQIMRQGESDAYYYIVKRGACRVTTRPADGAPELELARLGEGDGFGEDALITDGRRAATVTMLVDGSLMRLSKSDFTSLLVEPVLQYVDAEGARAMLAQGAVLLDVRKPEEYARDGLPQAVNIPLSLLRSRSHELDPAATYVTVSNVLNRSTAAAFFICQHGMEVYILKDGIKALAAMAPRPAAKAAAPRHAPALTVVEGGTPAQAAAPPSTAVPAAAPLATAPIAAAVVPPTTNPAAAPPNAASQAAAATAAVPPDVAALEERASRLAAEVEAQSAAAADLTVRLQDEQDRHRALEQRFATQQQSLERLRAEHDRGLAEWQGLRAERDRELAALQETLQQQHEQLRSVTAQGQAMDQELQRLRPLEREHAALHTEYDAAARHLAEAAARAEATAQETARRDEELQRLRGAAARGESIQAEYETLERQLHVEIRRREEEAAQLAGLRAELDRRGEQDNAMQGLETENTRLAEALRRERDDRRSFERELALQTVEVQRLRRAREETGGHERRVAELQAQLEAERSTAEARGATQTRQLQRLIQQVNHLRQRLKKVCTLARGMEAGRRAAEQRGEDRVAEIKALKDQVYERSLRLAELELVRRKLEQDLAALREGAAQTAVRPAAASPAPALQLPAPEHRTPPAARLSRLSAVGRRAMQAAVLIVITLLCVYGLLATGILKAHAGDWQSRIMHITGLSDEVP